jgi:hypothetical protein
VPLRRKPSSKEKIMARQTETVEMNMELVDIPGTSLKVSSARNSWARLISLPPEATRKGTDRSFALLAKWSNQPRCETCLQRLS